MATNYNPPDSPPIYLDNALQDKNLSVSFQDVWDGPVASESSRDLPANYLIVGIGARVAADPRAVTTIIVHAREHRVDGSLGQVLEFRGGSVPNANPEAWCAAPNGYVMAGVGGRIADFNLTTLHIWERPCNQFTRTLGQIQLEPRRCGIEPSAGWERRTVTWEHTGGSDVDRTVLNGIAMSEHGNNLNSLRLRFRLLR